MPHPVLESQVFTKSIRWVVLTRNLLRIDLTQLVRNANSRNKAAGSTWYGRLRKRELENGSRSGALVFSRIGCTVVVLTSLKGKESQRQAQNEPGTRDLTPSRSAAIASSAGRNNFALRGYT